MCSRQLDSSEKPTSGPWCPDGWKQAPRVNSFCYKLVTGSSTDTDFDGAQKYCEGLAAETQHTTNLASIEDIYEDNFIASLLYSKETNFDPTFGGSGAPGIWIGLSGYQMQSESGSGSFIKWSWKDGFPTAYTRWGPNEPKLENIPTGPERK